MLSRKLGIPTPADGAPTESFFYCNQVVSLETIYGNSYGVCMLLVTDGRA